jgi:hypothetical protein
MKKDNTYQVVAQNSAHLDTLRIELDTEVSTAKAYPRDVNESMGTILDQIRRNRETARKCFYVLPGRKRKDGTVTPDIMGPSIRLLELCAAAWGNIRYGARTVEVDTHALRVTVEAFAWDLQSNVRPTEQVTRRIYANSDDAIQVGLGAARSIAIRNVLRRLLGPHAEEAYEAAYQFTIAETTKDPKRYVNTVEYFKQHGFEEKDVLMAAGVKSEKDLTDRHYLKLRGLATALEDGYVEAEDMLAQIRGESRIPDPGGGTLDPESLRSAEPDDVRRKPVEPEPETEPEPEQEAEEDEATPEEDTEDQSTPESESEPEAEPDDVRRKLQESDRDLGDGPPPEPDDEVMGDELPWEENKEDDKPAPKPKPKAKAKAKAKAGPGKDFDPSAPCDPRLLEQALREAQSLGVRWAAIAELVKKASKGRVDAAAEMTAGELEEFKLLLP